MDQVDVQMALARLIRHFTHEKARDQFITRGEIYALLNELALLVDLINQRASE